MGPFGAVGGGVGGARGGLGPLSPVAGRASQGRTGPAGAGPQGSARVGDQEGSRGGGGLPTGRRGARPGRHGDGAADTAGEGRNGGRRTGLSGPGAPGDTARCSPGADRHGAARRAVRRTRTGGTRCRRVVPARDHLALIRPVGLALTGQFAVLSGRHLEHPTAAEGCRSASQGLVLTLITVDHANPSAASGQCPPGRRKPPPYEGASAGRVRGPLTDPPDRGAAVLRGRVRALRERARTKLAERASLRAPDSADPGRLGCVCDIPF